MLLRQRRIRLWRRHHSPEHHLAMTKKQNLFRLCLTALLFLFSSSLFADAPPVPASPPKPKLVDPVSVDQASNAMVVTAHPKATEAALEILQAGGNAVDAAIAAQWVLNVVEPESSGIGGGGFFLYFDAKKRAIRTFDGREKAPEHAFPEMFMEDSGEAVPFYPDRVTGGLPVGVPGTLKLLKRVHDALGSKKIRFDELFNPAIKLADNGIPVSRRLAGSIREEEIRLKRFDASRAIFFHPDGTPYKEGETLVQKDLAHTFETIAQKGIGAFYEGEIAKAMVRAVQKSPYHPGLLDSHDLLFYDIVEREALHGSYRGHDIFTMGPPSSGGVALLEILNILENYSLIFYGPSADTFHLVIEAQKMAFEDRAVYLGDPDRVEIPVEKLISKEYAKKKAKTIKFEEAKVEEEPLVEEASRSSKGNTSHISIRDAEGNIVSYTTTIEHIFGSAMVVPGWGFFLNNELTDFAAVPRASSKVVDSIAPKGTLIHSAISAKLKPNAPGPEKRPRSSMCPTIVFRNGIPLLVTGSPGGSLIIPTVQEIVMYLIDFKMPPDQVLAAPRFAARGNEVETEADFFESPKIIQSLKERGHRFSLVKPFGNAQAIFFDHKNDSLIGVSDPRGEGEARGY